MIVTFESRAHANITMFGDHAKKLIKMMGHSGTVPSSILAADLPAALEQLRQGIAKQASADDASGDNSSKRDDDQNVSLATRALPLVQLLEAAIEEDEGVTWRAG